MFCSIETGLGSLGLIVSTILGTVSGLFVFKGVSVLLGFPLLCEVIEIIVTLLELLIFKGGSLTISL